MPYEAAKCPTCGASIQVDTNTEKCFCSSCGNHISTVAAVKKLLVDVNLDGVSTVKNTIMRGNQCLEVQDWDAAAGFFGSVVDKQADNFDSWYGLLKALTHNFRRQDVTQINLEGDKGLKAVLRNALRFGSPSAKEAVVNEVHHMVKLWAENLENDLNNNKKSKNYVLWVFLGSSVLFFLVTGYLPVSIFLAGIPTILSYYLSYNQQNKRNSRTTHWQMDYELTTAKQIRSILKEEKGSLNNRSGI